MKFQTESSEWLCVICCTVCEGHKLTVVPQNTAVMLGSELTLHCATNTKTKLSWYFGHGQVKIFNGFNMSPEFQRHKIQDHDLVIRDVRLSDAGLYTCLYSKSHRASAEVIVIGKNSFVRSFIQYFINLVIQSLSIQSISQTFRPIFVT